MGSVERYQCGAGARYRVRWRKPDHSQGAKRGFRTKREAELYLASVELDKSRGVWVDPSAGRVTVEQWTREWLEHRADLRASSRDRAEGAIVRDIVPALGRYPLGELSHKRCQEWASSLSSRLGPSSVRKSVSVLSGALEAAVRDGRLNSNPAHGLRLPRVPKASKQYLTHEQVWALARAVESIGGGSQNGQVLGYGLLVRLLALCGLRWSELSGLRVGDVDFAKRRLHVRHTVVEVGGVLHEGQPKSYEARSVPIPRRLLTDLEGMTTGRDDADPLFPSARSHSWLRNRTFRRGWLDDAAEAIDVTGLTPHELRHTAASLAISAGAHVKAVQRMLGHASAAITLDTYSDLFDDDLDDVADRLDEAAARADVSKSCPQTEKGGGPE